MLPRKRGRRGKRKAKNWKIDKNNDDETGWIYSETGVRAGPMGLMSVMVRIHGLMLPIWDDSTSDGNYKVGVERKLRY